MLLYIIPGDKIEAVYGYEGTFTAKIEVIGLSGTFVQTTQFQNIIIHKSIQCSHESSPGCIKLVCIVSA
jgi:predicted DNA-binding protein with PD1-like motif